MLDRLLSVFVLTVLLVSSVRADAASPNRTDPYEAGSGRVQLLQAAIGAASHISATVPGNARSYAGTIACASRSAPADPLTASGLTLPAGELIAGETGLRICGVRGAGQQLLRSVGETRTHTRGWDLEVAHLPRTTQPSRLALPSAILQSGLQTWTTATPPPFQHC